MGHLPQRALAASLSAFLAAQPALAVEIAERTVVKSVELPSKTAPLELAKPAVVAGLTGAILPAPLAQISAAPGIIAAPGQQAAEAKQEVQRPDTQALAAAGRNIVSSESPMEKAKTLDSLYDKHQGKGEPVGTQSSPPPEIPASGLTHGRLPRTVVPKRYDVHLKVDPAAGGFSGRVKIAVSIARPTKSIVMHSLGHSVTDVIVGGERLDIRHAVVDAVAETLTIALPREVPAGETTIELAYTGEYNKQMRGLYESKAKFEGKEEKYAFTHLEPTNARRVFPAFDEPDFKAEFALTVEAPAHLTVLSNMPPAERKVDGAWQTVSFKTTPKMSTYLCALAVARLVPVGKTVNGTRITVWTMPQDAGQAGFALEVAENALKRLNKYFGIKYFLPKLDLVAVPDFAAGAMENWGALFFRDSALLVDPKLSSTKARRRVAEVVTHEIVHQWFGDLVTMKWWNDLWLNEAFATWMAYKIIQDWKPGWNEWIEFEQRKREPLAIDALKTTRAISAGVASTAEIQAQFDPLTYSKGGALLRMIEGYLTEDRFRTGIRVYMRRYRFGNTEARDLWRELERASGQPVMKMAEDWLGKPGYPVVSVSALSKDNRKLKVAQSRFSASGTSAEHTAWTIPLVVNYRLTGSRRERTYRVLLKEGETTITLPGRGRAHWVYPNDDETGFYRVRLDARLLSAARRAAASELDPLERMGLLNHLWAQVKSGDLPIGDFLDTLVALKKDGSRVALEEVSAYLRSLSENLASSQADTAALARMTRDLLTRHWKKTGWEARPAEEDEPKLARASLLSALAVVAPDKALKDGLKKRLASYLEDPASIDPAIASQVLSLNARLGQAQFDDYRRRLAAATTPEQRDSLLAAMAQFRDPALANKLLTLTLTDGIRGQDAWKPFGVLFANREVQGTAWDFVKAHWRELREKLGPRGAARVIEATAGLQSEAWLADVGTFFNDPSNKVDSAKRALDQTLESIALAVRFKKTQASRLSEWLAARYPEKN